MTEVIRLAAKSIVDYMSIVDSLGSGIPGSMWYRGQSNSSHRLIPSALRNLTRITGGRGEPITKGHFPVSDGGLVTGPNPEAMLAEFKRSAYSFVEKMPANDFEWLFLAQHHGLPTRLLDWSTNALAALHFAASGAEIQDGDGSGACQEYIDGDEFRNDGFAVFIMDPIQMNKLSHDVEGPVDISANEEKWRQYLDPMRHIGIDSYLPVCVTAPHVSPRIRAQSGTFTLHGQGTWALDYFESLRPIITKVYFPYTATRDIMASLAKAGINKSFIYPGLDSIAEDVKYRHTLLHHEMKEKYFDGSNK